MVSRHVLYHACWARAWRCQQMSESTLVCITLEERCTSSRHTFGACSQRWVCSGSHTDVHEASQAASWASGDDGIARAQMCPQCTHATDDPPRQSGGDQRHRQPTEPTDENDLICRLPASYPEASTQTHPTQMGLFACLLSAPKINLICPVSARICADPLHCRPSIEYASASFKEVRTPASPNPLLTYP